MLARDRDRDSDREMSEEEEDEDAQEAEEGGREEIRKQYRGLIDEAVNNRQDLVSGDAENLMRFIEKGDNLFSMVKQTREATLDSQLLELTSHIGAEKIQQLSTGMRQYNVQEYIVHLKKELLAGADSVDDGWETFHENFVDPYFSRVPRATFLYGSLDKEDVVRQVRKPKEKDKVEQKVVPKELKLRKERTKNEESEITRRVTRVFETLNQVTESTDEKPVFWEFLHDPDSFSRSVENLFHFAFLMKDGHAKTTIDSETGLPVIEPSDPPDAKDWEDGSAKQWQTVVRLDWALWEKLNENAVPRLIEPMEEREESEESSEEQASQRGAKRGGGASQKRRRDDSDDESSQRQSQSQSSQKRRRK
eukprot:TRINITY_DN9273_c0_g1_i2.p1 TRINITY_DN9273_c0_g1~~TRINITY_DN9273_c0_g1_i2.p1  ORF type:complete len:364 (+),score=92.32 TRINITY_DN9273_c0_g1_i2:12-1103(+)